MEKAEGTCLLSLRNTFYYLLPLPPGKIPLQQATQLDRFHEKLLPFTVLTWVKDLLNQSDLESVFDRFSTEDDVWCRDFSSGKPN